MLKYTIAIYANISDCEGLLKHVVKLYSHFINLEILCQRKLIFRKENLENCKNYCTIKENVRLFDIMYVIKVNMLC